MSEKETFTVSEVISSIIAIAFTSSICYQIGFFSRIGVKPTGIYTTGDIFNASILWMPAPIFIMITILVIHLLNVKVKKLTIKKITTIDTYPMFWIKLTIFTITNIFIILYYKHLNLLYFIFFLSILLFYLVEFVSHDYCQIWSNSFRVFLSTIVALIYLAFFLGLHEATIVLSEKKTTIQVDNKTYFLLRKFEAGMLIYEKNNNDVVFIDNNNTYRITYKLNDLQ